MRKHADYVPLHLHTEYSLLNGAIKIKELVETAKEWGLPAVAMTDHGNLFGAVDFYKQCTKADIKPIIGSEVYLTTKSRLDRQKEESPFHLVLLARDNDGYKNLVTLVSKAFIEGFYYKPRIDKEILEQYSGGLIALSACMKGEVPWHLMRNAMDSAREAALWYKHVFGPENYYMELQENGLPEQAILNKKLLELARELNIRVVATNDCHYLKKEDARAHDILVCIQTGKTVNDPNRLKFQGDGLYFKSPEEMGRAFADLPEAISNTMEIAEKCNVEFHLKGHYLPKFESEDGSPPGKILEALVKKGMEERFGPNPAEAYQKRLSHEMAVIKKMGYESYFLIVSDFINHAKRNFIPVGPGRGSAAGSLVAYALAITEIDPIRYGLLFERFLNPERVSMPDIDTDFCKDRRQEIIDYVAKKYGAGHVAQIITFGTLGAKAAIRDVARALDIPYQEADKIAKLVPDGLNVSLDHALRMEPRLKEMYETEASVKELIDIAKRLEGLSRHASTHAAGVVISPEPLTEIAPLYKNPTDGTITTQFDMVSIDSLGLVKFDLLGLKTLTIIDKTVRFIKERGEDFSLKEIPLDDPATYALLSAGHSTGVFQLESAGMRDILIKLGPERFEDLIALVALYRPGPIGSGMIDDFINRKKGRIPIKHDLPGLKDILGETYGVILYQEQVMEIAHRLAGFSLGQADILRKAMGKKMPEEMEKQKEAFIKGAKANNTAEAKARKLFELMAKFAEYGFNKSHSAAYAYVAYQTAYLKAHYGAEFMAATMSVELDNTDKIMKFIKECQAMGIKVLPPDINVSDTEFKIIGGAVRFGMGAVKGAGAQAIEQIVGERTLNGPFETFEDFLERTNKKVNKKVLEALVKAGAFDSLGITRKGCAGLLETHQRGESIFQQSFFGGVAEPALKGQAPAARDEWDEQEMLRNEKEALGFYVSGNPLTRFKDALLLNDAKNTAALLDMEDKTEIAVAGIISAVKKIKTREKGLMASLQIEDDEGSVDVVVFPDLYKENGELLKKDVPVFVRGTLEKSDKGPKVIARQIMHLEEAVNSKPNGKKLELSVPPHADLKKLKEYIEDKNGGMPLFIRIKTPRLQVIIETSFKVPHDGAFRGGLMQLLGDEAEVKFI